MNSFFRSANFRLLVAALLGSLAVLGFAPFYIYPSTIFSIAGLFYLWHRADNNKQAAWLGFFYGLGLFIAGIYWIYISLHDFGGMPWWMAAFSTFCLCAFLSLFPALVGWLSKRSSQVLLSAPLLWALAEWVRSWIFTGFPWLTIGYSQTPGSPLAGFMPIIGVYGVSLLTAITAVLLVYILLKTRRKIMLAALIALWISGALLKMVPWTSPIGEPISVALLQGNIAQDLKWQEGEVQRTLDKYLQLTTDTTARLIVLPETALPMLLQYVPEDYLAAFKSHAQQHESDILFGVVEYEDEAFYNSMLSIGSSPVQAYRKTHLVPFGEFIPLKSVFGWIYEDWLNIPLTDLARGGFDQKPLAIAGQKVAVNICYEDVFGEEIIYQLPEATILVNTSNDAWYGESPAAYQHLQISQARALETGRMMLRSTNTGATAIIEKNGEVRAHLPHFRTGILEGEAQGYSGSTPYIRFGNWLFLLITAAGLVYLLWLRKKK
ncbi:MAG: apolipoprotein N-acyltransferase [Betaproteobacteria bacterium HGW-Betaproteobacteria-2]|nr:MAG: apolipoprotein N-acyltransferase [Betaproteobacteria bacterium HGW-Betaproteobacteria-2]